MKEVLACFFKSLTVLMVASFCFTATAQNFPSKPIKIVVPFGPGGVADLTARIVAQKMGSKIGQSVVVENRPGAGGVVAGDLVAKADPDGHTLLLMSNGTAISATLFQKLPYDTLKDFEAISTLGFFDIGIVVNQSSPFQSLKDLINFSKSNPGKINIASINIGSTQNLAAELFRLQAGLNLQVVPFNGTPAVITAIRGEQVDAAVEIMGPLVPQIKSKSIRLLAVSGAKRSAFFPDIPTANEMGVKDYALSSWNALAAPGKTPNQIILALNQAVVDSLNDPEVKSKLQDLFIEPQSSSPKEMKTLLENDVKRWASIIEKANVPKQ